MSYTAVLEEATNLLFQKPLLILLPMLLQHVIECTWLPKTMTVTEAPAQRHPHKIVDEAGVLSYTLMVISNSTRRPSSSSSSSYTQQSDPFWQGVIKGFSFLGGSICLFREVAREGKKRVGARSFSGGWIERFWEVARGAG